MEFANIKLSEKQPITRDNTLLDSIYTDHLRQTNREFRLLFRSCR